PLLYRRRRGAGRLPANAATTRAQESSSRISFEHRLHDCGHAGPFRLLRLELPAADRRDAVVSGAPVRIGPVPLRANELTLLQSLQAGVKASHVQANRSAGYLFDTRADGVPMHRAEGGERLEDHEVKSALKHAGALFIWHSNTVWRLLIRMSNG